MRRIFGLAAGFCLLSGMAFAQAEQSAQPLRIVITKTDCSRLIRHVPAPDVAYKPGVDVHGRAVAPADMPGSGADAIPGLLPDVLEFPITINPISYGARNLAQREKAAALEGQSSTYTSKVAAQAQITSLTAQQTTLTTQAATLATEKAALDADYTTATTTLATLQAEVDAGTRTASSRDYQAAKRAVTAQKSLVDAKQAEISANSASQTATTKAIATQQAIVDGSAAKTEQYTAAQAAAEAKLATISAKGLDSTTMKVGTVRYDVAKGTFTFNDQPLLPEDQEELARACQKRGVR
ncbi:hypothetical protein [Magnetospirillum aberrantis]|uniref:Uncharacterized protein n=1 Tax=Magnetospirillum aberrantis SpK TaxID=908842 RepID=A0A7C9UYZ6_9PROT|nr:hypothetical protein [Magnetospirillum aberrantis]NFV79934.1 hypothetical protein [Magnetospirillum aberrantis SpK]